MSLHPAVRRLAFLPVLVLLTAATACSLASVGPGTISILVTGGRGAEGLGVEHCKRSVDPNEILKAITVRDEDGTEVASVTVRGRDATVKKAGVNGRRCNLRAVKTVGVQTGTDYVITADGETTTIIWPREPLERCLGGDCFYYLDKVGVHFYVRGEREAGEIQALFEQGYRRVAAIARMWNIPGERVMQIANRDDFPAPARVVGTRNLWLLEDLHAWWCRDGRHVPGSCEV